MEERKLRLIRSTVGATLTLGVATPLFWVNFGSSYGVIVLLLGLGIAATAVLQATTYFRLKKQREKEEKEKEK